MRAKLAACDSGKPYRAKELMFSMMVSCVFAPMPLARHAGAQLAFEVLHALPSSGACPTARRSSSASAPVKLATVMAMRRSCS